VQNPGIIIVGLFRDEKKYPKTQASELAGILSSQYEIITVSHVYNRILRLLDIIFTLWWKRKQYDIGIVQFYSGNSFIWQYIACKLLKLLNKKLVITIHGGAVPERIDKYPSRYLSVINSADAVTCPSGFMISKLEKYNIYPALIENSIPVYQYTFLSKVIARPVLLWMRAFSGIYNPEMAVRVVKILKKEFPAIKLYMAGPDLGTLSQTKNLIYSLQLQDNIEIIGFLDIEKKRDYTEKADIFISTNRIDNAPVTFIEMWAIGLPVVSTDVGGVSHMVSNERTGLLCGVDDDHNMAMCISTLIKSPVLFQSIVQNAKGEVNNYSQQTVASKWKNLLDKI
jgi:glycosyltransferase involved in cell wall biosynthesis